MHDGVAHVDFDGGGVDDLHGVDKGVWAGDGGLCDEGLWAVHAEHVYWLLVDDVVLHAEGLDRAFAVVEFHGDLFVDLEGLGEGQVGVHVGDLDKLIWDVDEGTLGGGLDFWEIEEAEDALWSDHLYGHWCKSGWERTSVGGLGLNGHDEGVRGGMGDLDKIHLQLGEVENSLNDGIHFERDGVSKDMVWGITN